MASMAVAAAVPSQSRTRTPQATSRLGIPSARASISKTASVRPSQTRGLANANNFDIKRSTVFADKDILRNVLSFVDYDDLLRSRLVNKFWNDTVCTNPFPSPGTTTTSIWPKLKLRFPKPKAKKKIGNEDEMDLAEFEAFRSSSLIQKFHCPNIRFIRVDLRKESVQTFFITQGPYIRNLRLENCVMSLVTFQRVVNKCPYLLGFKVYGLFHCMTQAESVLSAREAITLCSFANLKMLSIESTYVRRSLFNFATKDPNQRHNVPVQQIHSLVIHELLNTATQLEWLRVSGFGFATVISIMQTLVTNPVHTNLLSLEFKDISDGAEVEGFREWAKQLSHMKLQNFALTFLVGPLSKSLAEPSNMDRGIQEFLIHHAETLVDLNLTHCHVTDKIFKAPGKKIRLPNLKTLILRGTKILKIPRATKQTMESLSPDDCVLGKEDDLVGEDMRFRSRVAAMRREQELQVISDANQEIRFSIYTPWDRACFFILGLTILVGLGQFLTGALGEPGKFLYILAAGVILTVFQRMREA